jgi:hypothetical protein
MKKHCGGKSEPSKRDDQSVSPARWPKWQRDVRIKWPPQDNTIFDLHDQKYYQTPATPQTSWERPTNDDLSQEDDDSFVNAGQSMPQDPRTLPAT